MFLNDGVTWPTGLRRYNAFELRFVTSAQSEEVFETCIKRLVATWYENREEMKTQDEFAFSVSAGHGDEEAGRRLEVACRACGDKGSDDQSSGRSGATGSE